ncbi:MAG: pyridoxal-phosphate dependent enzyme [Leptospiraceae bacterium]|nr:pyridoxal-phosphate dependent enzyme [Leptospiraceae bacterium]
MINLYKLKKQETPIEFLENVSNILKLPIWIKREDKFLFQSKGGSKVRKLIYIFEDIINNNYDEILTIGSYGSHHVNATAYIGKKLGIPVKAILLPQPFTSYAKNIFKNSKLYLTSYIESNYTNLFTNLVLELFMDKKKKLKTYYLPPGGTNKLGIQAYNDAGKELSNYISKQGNQNNFDLQVCIYGTGGITAGLLNPTINNNLPPIYAIQVYPGFWNGKYHISYLSRKLIINNIKTLLRSKKLTSTRNYLGNSYGSKEVQNEEAVKLFAKDKIFLDPIYLARAGRAIIDLSKQKEKPKGILLWYTSPNRFF